MNWNHRIVDMSHENGGDPWFEIKEVHYENNGKIIGYADICTGDETAGVLIFCLVRMLADVMDKRVINGVTLKEIEND